MLVMGYASKQKCAAAFLDGADMATITVATTDISSPEHVKKIFTVFLTIFYRSQNQPCGGPKNQLIF